MHIYAQALHTHTRTPFPHLTPTRAHTQTHTTTHPTTHGHTDPHTRIRTNHTHTHTHTHRITPLNIQPRHIHCPGTYEGVWAGSVWVCVEWGAVCFH